MSITESYEKSLDNVKEIVITHTDFDGLCSGAAYERYAPAGIERLYIRYNLGSDCFLDDKRIVENIININDVINYCIINNIKIIMLDISLSTNSKFINTIFKDGIDITVIDHHQTTFDFMESEMAKCCIANIHCNTAYCGAMNTFMHLSGKNADEAPYIVRLANDHDLWIHSDPKSVYMNEIIMSDDAYQNPKSEEWSSLFNEEHLNKMAEIGKFMYDTHMRINMNYWKLTGKELALKFVDPDGNSDLIKIAVINGVGNSNLFPTEVYETNDLVIRTNICYTKNGVRYSCTAYSNNNSNVRCNKIAEYYGGGGHTHAAGFKTGNYLFITTEWNASMKRPVVVLKMPREVINEIIGK